MPRTAVRRKFGARLHQPLRMRINNLEARHVFLRDRRRLPLRHSPPACSISFPRLPSTFDMTASRPIIAFTVVCLLAGAPWRAFAQSGGMDHSKHRMGPEIVIPKGALYTKADVEFMQGMIAHHAQAIVMAHIAEKNSTNQQLLKLSRKIDQSQVPEILIMQEWLRRHGQFAPDTASWHDMRMDGMLTDDELEALSKAKGVAFDRL